MTDKHYLTKEGLEKLEKELADLRDRRKIITQRIEEAIKMGDLSENAEYSDAKEEQAFTEGRIAEVETIIKNSEIISKGKKADGTVGIGSTVEVKFNGSKKSFTIVGPEEVNPTEGYISHESPLGKAFLDHKKGEEVEVETPNGVTKFKILSVS